MDSDSLITKSVRLPASVVAAAEAHAQALGLTFSDLVEGGLRKEVGMKVNPASELLSEIAKYLMEKYPAKRGFPVDVTLEVFHEIQGDPGLRSLYDQALLGADGTVDPHKRHSVHKGIGALVKRVLDARVIGRSVELDPEVHLVRTHALLAPGEP